MSNIADEYFEAVTLGDLNKLDKLLKNASDFGLDVNFIDDNGLSAYAVAINEGFEVIVRILLKHEVKLGDALLFAVENGLPDVVTTICTSARRLQHKERMEIVECHCVSDKFPAFMTPIILASHNNNFKIVQLLYDNGARVPDPLDPDKFTAPEGTLQRSTETLNIYTAMASEAYISVSSVNPIESAFDLALELRDLADRLEEFRNEFTHLATHVDAYAGKILGKARTTEEILSIITYTDGQSGEPHLCEMELVKHAVDGDHKEFIAHPNCQNVVIGQFYRHFIWLRDYSTPMQILVNTLTAIMFPVLSLLFLLCPSKAILRILRVPYIKFFMHIGSEITFLGLLVLDSVYKPTSKPMALYITVKVLITLWVFGKIWEDIKRLTDNSTDFFGKDLSTSIYNFTLFIVMLAVLMLELIVVLQDSETNTVSRFVRETPENTTFISEGIPKIRQHILDSLETTEENVNSGLEAELDRFLVELLDTLSCDPDPVLKTSTTLNPCEETELFPLDSNHPARVASSLYSLAIILAILRLSSIIVVNDVIGPLQISLGGMTTDIITFGCIFSVVWLAFAIGMNQLLAPFQEVELAICQSENDDGSCTNGYFSTIPESLKNLYWTLYGFSGFYIAHVNVGNFVMTELISIILFGLYNVVALVILLNALVAMMTNTYCKVEENADVEWKFSRTSKWMTYMTFDVSLPPPFNLLPSIWMFCKDRKDETEEKSEVRVDYFRRQYKRVIGTLVERFIHDTNTVEDSAEAGISKKDLTSLKTDILTLRYECGQMLKGLNNRMRGALDFTDLTNTKLEIAHGIDDKVEEMQDVVKDEYERYQLIYEELKEINETTAVMKPLPPKRPMRNQTTRVSNMTSIFNEAVVSGVLHEEAKGIFNATHEQT